MLGVLIPLGWFILIGIPQVIEKLYRLKWSAMDGVGAVIISPTRELSIQIFDELRKVGKHHSLSAGLLIGGRKGVETEKETVSGLNILVCTPGRLLQHMDETPNFDCSQLQVIDFFFWSNRHSFICLLLGANKVSLG